MNTDKYLIISNAGEIDVDSFKLLGNSTKRNDPDKIGRFGSGLKYAIARLLAMDIEFTVYSGDQPIIFHTEETDFRGEKLDVIYIDGERTNFTTQMGPDWKEFDCLREIYANAVDEGLLDFSVLETPYRHKGETTFWIEITPEIQRILDNPETYFGFMREDAIWEGKHLKVYPSCGHLVIYKDGFKVYEDEKQPSLFNYDYSRAKINESRVLESQYSTSCSIATILVSEADQELVNLLKSHMHYRKYDGDMWEWNMDWWTFVDANETWQESFSGKTVVSKDSKEFYSDFMEGMKEAYVAPKKLAQTLRRKAKNMKMLGGDSDDKSNSFIELDSDSYEAPQSLESALQILRDANVQLTRDIVIAKFEHSHVMGTCDVENNRIVLSKELLDRNDTELTAEVILEEHFHFESRQNDATRGFQNYLIKQVLKYMKLYNRAIKSTQE